MYSKIREVFELYSGITLPPTYKCTYCIVNQAGRRRLWRPFCRHVVAAVHWTVNGITRQSRSRITCRSAQQTHIPVARKAGLPALTKSGSLVFADNSFCCFSSDV